MENNNSTEDYYAAASSSFSSSSEPRRVNKVSTNNNNARRKSPYAPRPSGVSSIATQTEVNNNNNINNNNNNKLVCLNDLIIYRNFKHIIILQCDNDIENTAPYIFPKKKYSRVYPDSTPTTAKEICVKLLRENEELFKERELFVRVLTTIIDSI